MEVTVGPLGVGGPRACWKGPGSGAGWRPLRVRSRDRAHTHLPWPAGAWVEAARWQVRGSAGVLTGVKLEHSRRCPWSSGQS